MELTLESAFSSSSFSGHLAYVLLVGSMLMRSMVLLRLLVIASALVGIIYSSVILTDPVSTFWETMLLLVNVCQLALTWWLDRSTQFEPHEAELRARHFPDLSASRFSRLLRSGAWMELPGGTVLAAEGRPVNTLTYLRDGQGSVSIDGIDIAHSEAGTFVGEMTVLTGEPANATVVLDGPAHAWVVDARKLRRLASDKAEIGHALEAAFFRMLRSRLTCRNLQDRALRAT